MSLTRDRLGHSQRYPPFATLNGHSELVHLLLEVGADKMQQEIIGQPPAIPSRWGLCSRVWSNAFLGMLLLSWWGATVREAVRPLRCPFCHADVVPCIDHVLWVCPSFAARRVFPRPNSALAARLGWDAGWSLDSCVALLCQMGTIRREEHTPRQQTLQAPIPEDLA